MKLDLLETVSDINEKLLRKSVDVVAYILTDNKRFVATMAGMIVAVIGSISAVNIASYKPDTNNIPKIAELLIAEQRSNQTTTRGNNNVGLPAERFATDNPIAVFRKKKKDRLIYGRAPLRKTRA